MTTTTDDELLKLAEDAIEWNKYPLAKEQIEHESAFEAAASPDRVRALIEEKRGLRERLARAEEALRPFKEAVSRDGRRVSFNPDHYPPARAYFDSIATTKEGE